MNYKKTLSLALAGVCTAAVATAQTVYTDNFNTVVDYNAVGVGGSIWDGLAGGGHVGRADTNISTGNGGSGALRLAADDSGGTSPAFNNVNSTGAFLYIDVAADLDFTLEVDLVDIATGNFSEGGILVRDATGPALPAVGNGTSELNYQLKASAFGGNQGLNTRVVTGSTQSATSTDTGFVPTTGGTLRLVKSGTLLTSSYDVGAGFVAHESITVAGFAGKALQVGLFEANYQNTRRHADFDDFSLTVVPEPSSLALAAGALVAGFLVNRRRRK